MRSFYLRAWKWFFKAALALSFGFFLIYQCYKSLLFVRFDSLNWGGAFSLAFVLSIAATGILLIYFFGGKVLQVIFRIPSLSIDESGVTYWSNFRGRKFILWREIGRIEITSVSHGLWAKQTWELLSFFDLSGKDKFRFIQDDIHVPFHIVLESIRGIPAAAHLLSESPTDGVREIGVPIPLSRPKGQSQRDLPLGGSKNLDAEFLPAEPKYRALLLADSKRSLSERKKLARIFVPQVRQLPSLQALQCLEILWKDSSFSDLGHDRELEQIGMDALKRALDSSDAERAWLSLRKFSVFLPVANLLPEIMRVTELYSARNFEAAMSALYIVSGNLALARLSLIDARKSLQGTISFCARELTASADLNEGNIHLSDQYRLLLYFLGDEIRAKALREKYWENFRNLSESAPLGVLKYFLPNDQSALELLGTSFLLEQLKGFPVSDDPRIESEVLGLMVDRTPLEHLRSLLLVRLELMKQKHEGHRWTHSTEYQRNYISERDELILSVVKEFYSGS